VSALDFSEAGQLDVDAETKDLLKHLGVRPAPWLPCFWCVRWEADSFVLTVRLDPRQRHPRYPEPGRAARRPAVRRPRLIASCLSASFCDILTGLCGGETHTYHLTTAQKRTSDAGSGISWAWLHGVYLGGGDGSVLDSRGEIEIVCPGKVSPIP
jgi:hypothetical protein